MSGGQPAGQSYRMQAEKEGEGEGDLEERPVNGYKTALCRYFAQGKCFRGSRCAFAHGPRELRRVGAQPAASSIPYTTPSSVKPSTLIISHANPTSAAASAAGPKTHLYKTQMCGFWLAGHCTNGASCTFAHGEKELRPMAPPPKPTFGEMLIKQLSLKSNHPSKAPSSPVRTPLQRTTSAPPRPSYPTTSKPCSEHNSNSCNQSYSRITARPSASTPAVPRPLPVAKDKVIINVNDVKYDTRPPYNPHSQLLHGLGKGVTPTGFQNVKSNQSGYERQAPITSLDQYNKLLGLT